MKILILFIIFGQINLPIYPKLKSNEDASKFLNDYCIEVIQFIKDTWKQKEFAKRQIGEALKIEA